LQNKGQKRKRNLRGCVQVGASDTPSVKQMLCVG